jgi:hypothetical protein
MCRKTDVTISYSEPDTTVSQYVQQIVSVDAPM